MRESLTGLLASDLDYAFWHIAQMGIGLGRLLQTHWQSDGAFKEKLQGEEKNRGASPFIDGDWLGIIGPSPTGNQMGHLK